MNHAKLFSVLVFLMVALYGAIGFYALPLASFQGDLTRMGLSRPLILHSCNSLPGKKPMYW
jgi:hypothetical protein